MYLDKTIRMFLERVEKAGPNDCWPWRGMIGNCGYGRIYEGRRELRATHIALFLDGRPRRDLLLACHTCDNPPCCNPRHLWWGTHADNMGDMAAKGRAWTGSRGNCIGGSAGPRPNFVPANKKRNPALEQEALYGIGSLSEIAARNGVSKRLIVQIRSEMGAAPRPKNPNLL